MMSNTWIISKNLMEMGKSPKVLPAPLRQYSNLRTLLDWSKAAGIISFSSVLDLLDYCIA
jgi:hypothetical protein